MKTSFGGSAAVETTRRGLPERRPASVAPACEALEDRRLLSAAATGTGTSIGSLGHLSPRSVMSDRHASVVGLHGRHGRLTSVQTPAVTSTASAVATTAAVPASSEPSTTTTVAPDTRTGTPVAPPTAAAGPFASQTLWFGPGPSGMFPGPWGPSAATSSGSTASGGTAAQGATAASSALATDIQKLTSDLQAVHDKSQVTPAEQAAVRNDLEKLQSEATTQPDAAKLTALENDISALSGQLPTSAQQTRSVSDFTAVLTSEGITDTTLINQTISDIQAETQATNITATDLATIAADQDAIRTDLGAGAPSDPANGPAVSALGGLLIDGLSGSGQLDAVAPPIPRASGAVVVTRGGAGATYGARLMGGGGTGMGGGTMRAGWGI